MAELLDFVLVQRHGEGIENGKVNSDSLRDELARMLSERIIILNWLLKITPMVIGAIFNDFTSVHLAFL